MWCLIRVYVLSSTHIWKGTRLIYCGHHSQLTRDRCRFIAKHFLYRIFFNCVLLLGHKISAHSSVLIRFSMDFLSTRCIKSSHCFLSKTLCIYFVTSRSDFCVKLLQIKWCWQADWWTDTHVTFLSSAKKNEKRNLRRATSNPLLSCNGQVTTATSLSTICEASKHFDFQFQFIGKLKWVKFAIFQKKSEETALWVDPHLKIRISSCEQWNCVK